MRQMVVRVGEKVIRLRQVSHVCPPAPRVENRCLRSIRRWPRSSRYSFWEFRAQTTRCYFTTTISSAACKLSYIGLRCTARVRGFQKFQYLEYLSPCVGIPRNVAESIVMQITVEPRPAGQVEADALIVPVFEGRRDARFGAADLFDSGEVAGKPLELTLLHHAPGVRATRVLLAGGGKPEKFDAAEMRRLSGAAVRFLKAKSIKTVAFALDPEFGGDGFVSAVIEGAILGDFEPDRYKTSDDKKSIDGFTLAADTPSLDSAAERGRVLGEAQNFTRDLVNQPANRLTPLAMADVAGKMAAEFGLECEVLDRDSMEKLGMGSLLGVAQGSAEPPVLIVLGYRPANAQGSVHLGLVGKGVTFDTGGISIKPADGMEKMKYDMAGGAAMMGTMRAI